MKKKDIKESTAIVSRMLDALLETGSKKGREGSDLRRACGDLYVMAPQLIQSAAIAEPLLQCFDLARRAGCTLLKMANVRKIIELQEPIGLAATLITEAGIMFALITEGRIIADMTFVSRQDADDVKSLINDSFNDAEEMAADRMAQDVYQGLVSLHAAIIFHLVETARPLPRMVRFRFAESAPTLFFAYRLYTDVGRADELLAENRVVHPAFTIPVGRALSA